MSLISDRDGKLYASESSVTIASRWAEANERPAGFDYLRITLAVSVLLWHSYLLTSGRDAALAVWRGPGGMFLELILPLFFALSGFLVSGSLERSANLFRFLSLRVIRIYPALCVEVLLSAFILGPLVTTSSLRDYFFSQKFVLYAANMIGWVHFYLPGVFLDNPLPGVVNSSLWTVPYELECYIFISVLVLIGYMRSKTVSVIMYAVATVFVIGLFYYTGEDATPDGNVHGRVLVLCFLAGAVIYRLKNVLPYSDLWGFGAIVASIFLLRSPYTVCIAPIFVAYACVYLGIQNPRRSIVVNSGDYSYGVYLYAGPIQQTFVWALQLKSHLILSALALPVTVLFALFSWHYVEKPFLKVKKLILKP